MSSEVCHSVSLQAHLETSHEIEANGEVCNRTLDGSSSPSI